MLFIHEKMPCNVEIHSAPHFRNEYLIQNKTFSWEGKMEALFFFFLQAKKIVLNDVVFKKEEADK